VGHGFQAVFCEIEVGWNPWRLLPQLLPHELADLSLRGRLPDLHANRDREPAAPVRTSAKNAAMDVTVP
jgi:hypothetical protein